MAASARRTTADLVAELREVAHNNARAALVVGFDHHTEFVWANDPDALDLLNSHMRNGGDPLGLVTGSDEGDGATRVRAHPLIEYEDDEWVEKYLISILAELRRTAAASGIETGPITG